MAKNFDPGSQGAFGMAPQRVTDPLHLFNPKEQNTSDDIDMGAWASGHTPAYQAGYDPNDPNYRAGYDLYKSEALRKGPSAWLNLLRSSNDLQTKDARDRGAQEMNSQTAKARDDLAASGGLTSGARERTAEQGIKNYMNMSQDITRQGQQTDLNAQIQDQQNHIGMLKGLTDLDTTRANQWSNEVARRNEHDMSAYQAQLQAMAAQEQAKATARSGGGKFGK